MKTVLKILCLSALSACILGGCAADSSDGESRASGSAADTDGIPAGAGIYVSAYDAEPDTSPSSEYQANESARDITEAPDEPEYAGTVWIDLSDETCSSDGASYAAISEDADSPTSVTLKKDVSLYINGERIFIEPGKQNAKFVFTGAAEDTSVWFDGKKGYSVGIELSDVTLSSKNYPPICVDSKSGTHITLSGTNTVKDGRSYGTGYGDGYTDSAHSAEYSGREVTAAWVEDGSDKKGSIFSKGYIYLSGGGSLSLTEGYKHGIYSKDYIYVDGAVCEINSSGRNGIQSVNGFVMDSGAVTVTGTGTYTNNQSRGIVVEGCETIDGTYADEHDIDSSISYDDENYYGAGEGFIVIRGGTLKITTVSKAITAKWDADDDAETDDTSDDPYPYVLISGGEITVKTTGTPADESSSAVTFTDADGVSVSEKTKLSPEGIEGKQNLFVTGGTLCINTTDDCINVSSATGVIRISGGNIFAYSQKNDAVDSNGELHISGGVIVALTKTTPECAFDCDENTFAITGGLVAGIGTNNYSEPTESSCTQSTAVLSGSYFGAGGTSFALVADSDGTPVFVYDIPSLFGTSAGGSYVMILSSPKIESGVSYSALSGVTVSGGAHFYGLYTTLPSVSGGAEKLPSVSMTAADPVYTKTSSSNGGAQDGPQNWGPGGGR